MVLLVFEELRDKGNVIAHKVASKRFNKIEITAKTIVELGNTNPTTTTTKQTVKFINYPIITASIPLIVPHVDDLTALITQPEHNKVACTVVA